jgi:acyl-CoA thioester hydrolase
MAGPFRYYLRVRYAECDAQRVVFNARYADYIDLATTEFVRALGFGGALLDGTLDYQLVKLTVEWKAPARYDQVLELSVSATRLGNTSFAISTEIRIAGQEPVVATAETINVTVDPRTLRKIPLPPRFSRRPRKRRPPHNHQPRRRCHPAIGAPSSRASQNRGKIGQSVPKSDSPKSGCMTLGAWPASRFRQTHVEEELHLNSAASLQFNEKLMQS